MGRGRFVRAGLLCLACAAVSPSSFAKAPLPEVLPSCYSPQPLNPLMPIGGSNVQARNGIVWNGTEYVVAYADGALTFQRVFADGTPDGPPTVNPGGASTNPYSAFDVSLTFDGTSYAAVFVSYDPSGYDEVFFVMLDLNFNVLVPAERVSFVGATPTANTYWPQIAEGGGHYIIVWYDSRTGYDQIYATVLDSGGTVFNSGTAHDMAVFATTANQVSPAVAWCPGASAFQIVWEDHFSGTPQIWGELWAPPYGFYYRSTIILSAGGSFSPHLAFGPSWGGLAWTDTRDGNDEIYFCLLGTTGQAASASIRLTNDPNDQSNPWVCWTGSQFGVYYDDLRYAGGDIGFQGVSANATLVGGNTQVTYGLGTPYIAAAFAKLGFLAVGYVPYSSAYAEPVGCNYASAPPCPSNMVAYGITGSSATISWQAANDPYTDIAYYAVYRDNALVGKTAKTFFTDTGLSLSTTYNYLVNAVNAADLVSSGCGTTNSVYVKTNATLVLTLSKSDPNAVLTWTDTSGQTLPSFNVYRGTSPQVMTQVATSSSESYTDPNALADTVLYFYSVDDPGQ